MRLKKDILELEIKIQDRYRKYFSSLGNDAQLKSTCVILGDSDIDYELAPNVSQSRILSAPYNVNGVKHKLIYNGVGKNLSGLIKCFSRKVLSDGTIQGLYNYPTDEIWETRMMPPSLENGKNVEVLVFDENVTKMGYILFFSTVLDYYFDENGVKKRLVEKYNFSFDWNGSEVAPTGWESIIDNDNGSLLLAKDTATVSVLPNCTITIIGQFSNKVKRVKFNL